MSDTNELDVGTFCPNQYKPRVLLAHHLSKTRNIRNLLVGGNLKHRHLDKTCEMRLISDNDLLSMLHFLEKVVRESLLLLDVWPREIQCLGYCALVILVSQNT